jgi:2,4-dienoyl-CoA reductase-like NADH-dependent reductase (Old Yellow Enzyme family)/thioredoxin reductase
MGIDTLFLPGKIGRTLIKNRIFMAPMSSHLVGSDGSVTKKLLDYHEERAKGGVGLIIIEAAHAEMEIARGSITGNNLRIDDIRCVIGLSELTDVVHMQGAKIFLQITMGQGSFCPPFLYPGGAQPVAPSRIKNPNFPKWTPRELTQDEIHRITEAYGEAALRAKMAGFDGVEIHGHGMYLLAQFMSPFTNKRKDRYGEPAALPLEMIKAVRDNVGEDYPISFRWNIDEFLTGGRDLERSKKDAESFEKAGIHAISISGGNFWVPGGAAHSCPPMSYPQGHLRGIAKAIRNTVSIPVMLSSKIGDPILASEILQRGEADFIGLGRGLLADPEWPNRVAEGKVDDIRPCIRDMDGCINRVAKLKQVSCTVNARCGREGKHEIHLCKKSKKVVVVGGGVAGMEAARVAALRGHDVTLFEASGSLGGQTRLAAMIPYKEDISQIIYYLKNQLEKAGVMIKLGSEATPELLQAMEPEAVVIAAGSKHLVPSIPGIDKTNVFLARDVVAETVDVVGQRIVVAGGGFVGCDTAIFLTVKKRKQVTIIEQLTQEAVGFEPYDMNYMELVKMLKENNVKILTETKIEEITSAGVRIMDKRGKEKEIPADSVVLALGAVPDQELLKALRGKVSGLYAIGDCNRPGKIIDAIHEGFYHASVL